MIDSKLPVADLPAAAPEIPEVAASKPARAARAKRQPARKADAPPAAPEVQAVPAKPAKPAKPARTAKPRVLAKASKPAKPVPSAVAPVPAPKPEPAKPARAPKEKLVRDSFTMPRADHALIALLKQRSLAFEVPVKKSELLRGGLHALAALPDAQLKALLAGLTPIKTGRPRKGH